MRQFHFSYNEDGVRGGTDVGGPRIVFLVLTLTTIFHFLVTVVVTDRS